MEQSEAVGEEIIVRCGDTYNRCDCKDPENPFIWRRAGKWTSHTRFKHKIRYCKNLKFSDDNCEVLKEFQNALRQVSQACLNVYTTESYGRKDGGKGEYRTRYAIFKLIEECIYPQRGVDQNGKARRRLKWFYLKYIKNFGRMN